MSALAEMHDAFADWIALPEAPARRYELIDLACATILANRLDGDPLWLALVAPPSSGKTEVLRGLGDVPDTFALSALTAQTFASGLEKPRQQPTSLLPQLDGKTVVMKDFGSVLSMHREKRQEILAQLREIYDGSYTKTFGTGKRFQWTGKMGLLVGVTEVIDREYAFSNQLGERFLLYRVPELPWLDLARRALESQANEALARRRIREAVATVLADCPLERPPIPAALHDPLCACATLIAYGRSPVYFDAKNRREHVPSPERPGRLTKQLALLLQSLAAIRHEAEVSLEAFETITRVAWDTMPAPRSATLRALRQLEPAEGLEGEDPTTVAVALATASPTSTARRHLEELEAVKLVERLRADKQGLPDRWRSSALLDILLRSINAHEDFGAAA